MPALLRHADGFLKHKQRAGGAYRRQRSGEDERTRAVYEESDQVAGCRDECSRRGQGLSERAHDYVYLADESAFLGEAEAFVAAHAHAMGLVEIDHCVGIAVSDFHEPLERRGVAVHAVDGFSRDYHAAVVRGVAGKDGFQTLHVVVGETAEVGLADGQTVDDRCMDCLVADEKRAGDGQRGGDSHVGMVSGIEKQRRLPVQFLEPVFKHLVMFLAAREQAGCR